MHDLTRASDLTAANNQIKMLSDRLVEARKMLAQCQIEFEVETSPDFDIIITAMKPYGGGGVRKTLSKETCLYYAQDAVTLVDSLVDEIVEALLVPQLKEALRPKLSRALDSLSKLQGKKL